MCSLWLSLFKYIRYRLTGQKSVRAVRYCSHNLEHADNPKAKIHASSLGLKFLYLITNIITQIWYGLTTTSTVAFFSLKNLKNSPRYDNVSTHSNKTNMVNTPSNIPKLTAYCSLVVTVRRE